MRWQAGRSISGNRHSNVMDVFSKRLIVFWIVLTLPLHGLAATLERTHVQSNYHVSLLSDAWAAHPDSLGSADSDADAAYDAGQPVERDYSVPARLQHAAGDAAADRANYGADPDSQLDAAPKRCYGEFGRIVEPWVVRPTSALVCTPPAVTLPAYRSHRSATPERPPR